MYLKSFLHAVEKNKSFSIKYHKNGMQLTTNYRTYKNDGSMFCSSVAVQTVFCNNACVSNPMVSL